MERLKLEFDCLDPDPSGWLVRYDEAEVELSALRARVAELEGHNEAIQKHRQEMAATNGELRTRAAALESELSTLRTAVLCIRRLTDAMLTVDWLHARQVILSKWVRDTIGPAEQMHAGERSLRVVEEAMELAQCAGVDLATIKRLALYVYKHPKGEPAQEIAGVLVTTLAAAAAMGVHAGEALNAEIERVHTPEIVSKCRRRQAEKLAAGVALLDRQGVKDGQATD